jgi:hypothetical protein
MKCVTPNAMKSKALVDLLAHFPSGEYEYAPPSEQNSQLQYWRKPTNFRKLASNVKPMSSRMCLRALYYEDWRKPYIYCISFLDHKILPSETKDVVGIKKRAFRFFAKQGELYKKGYNGHPLHPSRGCAAGSRGSPRPRTYWRRKDI